MIRNIVENHLVPKQDYVYGFADLQGLLPNKYSDYRFGISIGKRLDDGIINNLIEGPTMEYFNHYNNVNKQLAALTEEIQKDLSGKGLDSLPIVPTISVGSRHYAKYLKSLSYDISHKMVATRAGLGWIGKTDLLITKEFGPRVRLVTVLLKQDPGCNVKPVEKSKCGNCNICVLKCPANAATGLKWNVSVHRDEFFNAFKCREKCRELTKQKLNVEERICGLCISVCPIGRS
jgi:epoxyqueuosine reductase